MCLVPNDLVIKMKCRNANWYDVGFFPSLFAFEPSFFRICMDFVYRTNVLSMLFQFDSSQTSTGAFSNQVNVSEELVYAKGNARQENGERKNLKNREVNYRIDEI